MQVSKKKEGGEIGKRAIQIQKEWERNRVKAVSLLLGFSECEMEEAVTAIENNNNNLFAVQTQQTARLRNLK